jgi:hypothetical protein
MAATEMTLTLPPLESGPSEAGGIRFEAKGDDRSFRAVLRSFPGTMVYVYDEGGTRSGKGWASVDDHDALMGHLADLLLWVATGKVEAACRLIASRSR